MPVTSFVLCISYSARRKKKMYLGTVELLASHRKNYKPTIKDAHDRFTNVLSDAI